MAVPRVEKAYEKHAWTILFTLGILNILTGLSIIVEAIPAVSQDEEAAFGFSWTDLQRSDPGAATFIRYLFRSLGYAWLGFSLFTAAVALKSYRSGEKWAWYILWVFPLVVGLFAATVYFFGDVLLALPYAVYTTLAVLGLLLPYRKFFPKK